MNLKGLHVERNVTYAHELFTTAADLGLAAGHNALGVIYFKGGGGFEQDLSLALRHFQLAANMSNADGMFNAGTMMAAGVRPGWSAKNSAVATDADCPALLLLVAVPDALVNRIAPCFPAHASTQDAFLQQCRVVKCPVALFLCWSCLHSLHAIIFMCGGVVCLLGARGDVSPADTLRMAVWVHSQDS